MKRKHKLGCAGAAVIAACLAVMVTLTVMKLIDIGAFGRIKTEISLLADPIDKDAVSSEDDDWQLMLINADNPLPDNFSVKLTSLANGHKIDSRVYPHLQQMFDDARKQGIMPSISSSYRKRGNLYVRATHPMKHMKPRKHGRRSPAQASIRRDLRSTLRAPTRRFNLPTLCGTG